MVKAYPAEFRNDVIAVARKGDATVRQVAKDFGISETCLQRWLRVGDQDDGVAKPVSLAAEAVAGAELRRRRSGSGCWSRRTRSCAGRPRICRRQI